MKKLLSTQNLLGLILLALLSTGFWIYAQPSVNSTSFQKENASFDTSSFTKYERGVVKQVLEERIDSAPQNQLLFQHLEVEVITGVAKGKKVETEFTQVIDTAESIRFKVGDKLVLGVLDIPQQGDQLFTEGLKYIIVDRFRANGLILVVIFFAIIAILFGKSKGLLSMAGLALTALILVFFTAPQLLEGKNPVFIAGVSAGVIAITTMFIAHGFNRRTKISILSTLFALAFAIGVSYLFVYLGQLFGLGQADAFLLQTGYLGAVNLRGLLLAGLIISILGILDDVTTAQTATVDELLKANPQFSFKQLFSSAMSVGREHIASLINTLILVYVGASLPLFLLLVSATNQPLWVVLNSENMAEEIVRALAGSTALILSVPISTLVAVYFYKKSTDK